MQSYSLQRSRSTKPGKFVTAILLVAVVSLLTACASGPKISREQKLSSAADVPYDNLLIIALLGQYESRKRLERAIVDELAERGVSAVASTSQMKTTTPMTRPNYLKIVEAQNPEALMIIQLRDSETSIELKESASPEATYNVSPTWWFNVWEVELTEYREPKSPELTGSYLLLTEVYEVATRERVWAIKSSGGITGGVSIAANYIAFLDEGEAQVKRMRRDGLIP